jgi:hypothetical protein
MWSPLPRLVRSSLDQRAFSLAAMLSRQPFCFGWCRTPSSNSPNLFLIFDILVPGGAVRVFA